jgi:class 3 adenylate cyclase
MEAPFKPYDFDASLDRMGDILDQSDINYEETSTLPSRDKLTFTNGFYAKCAALFVDIRSSSDLPNKYKRPKLARLYRAFISECVACMTHDFNCREINVVGDGVWCVVNTPFKRDIDDVFNTACRLNSMVAALNCKMKKRGFEPIRVGIGASWGRALMIKAGFAGSGINDVVYMGDVVNEAAKLASKGGLPYFAQPIMLSSEFHYNLNEENQSFTSYNSQHHCYQSDAVYTHMSDWVKENCP